MKNSFNQLILHFARLGIVGLSPYAPGTCGSFLAIILAPFIFLPLTLFWQLMFLLLIFIIGGFASSTAEQLLAKKDPSSIVLDELLGQWICLLVIPSTLSLSALSISLVLAFGLFRFFDILKPFPIRQSETWLKDGFGVMIDDLIAGIYAAVVLKIILFFFM